VVTLETVPAPELPLEDAPEELAPELVDVPELVDEALVVLVAGVEATVVAEERLASAGSWPETSTSVISSQLATNSAAAPPMIRRRIERARASLLSLSACPRERAAGSMSVMCLAPRGRDEGWV
jgi:hypothetical protein